MRYLPSGRVMVAPAAKSALVPCRTIGAAPGSSRIEGHVHDAGYSGSSAEHREPGCRTARGAGGPRCCPR